MATADERRALAFLAALALMAGAVRYVGVKRFDREVRAAGGGPPPAGMAERALAAQIEAVDSARKAPRRRKSSKKETSSSRPRRRPTLPTDDASRPPLRVDVNAATVDELERLPRVGPALARRIVEWRERHGPFQSTADLRHVRGIGPSTVRLLDSLVTFSGGHSPLDSEGRPSPKYHVPSVY